MQAQIFNNYSVYGFGPGYSSGNGSSDYKGPSLTLNGAAGSDYFHVEVSSTIGYGKKFFMNEYVTLDLAAGFPFSLGDNAEALVALSPFSINLTVDGTVGMASMLKFRYGKLILENKLMLKSYNKQDNETVFLNNSYYGIRYQAGQLLNLGLRYTAFSERYHYLAFMIAFVFDD